VNLAPTDEQDQLRAAVRKFLGNRAPAARVREQMGTQDHDDALWRDMADLGLQALVLPAELGGADGSWADLAVVFEEIGRAVVPSPFLPTLGLAVPALLASGDDAAARELLPDVAAGGTVATLAWVEEDAWLPDAYRTRARQGDGEWRLSGTKEYVLDGQHADLVLVVADTEEGPSLFAVRAPAAGLQVQALPTLDQTRRLARIVLDDVPARLVGVPGAGGEVLEAALDTAAIALAAEMVGGAQRCLELAVDHASTREQFGRPIGSFQAVKHRCAEMLLGVESARAAVLYAAAALGTASPEVPALASLTKAWAAETYFSAAAENLQIHGGIGFTWEHEAHLHLKRAKADDLLLGDVSFHRRRLADRIGL
jgi:alkylation response protein AidB-like acyl-CoA dehydrogenase